MSSGYPPSGGLGGYYPGGGPEGIYGAPTDTRCCEDRIAIAIQSVMQSLVVSQQQIVNIIGDKYNKTCDNLDQCADELLAKLRKKVEGPLKNCKECQLMLQNGMGGTLEYAVQCANIHCDECDRECTLADPAGEGKCCKTCGKAPCCCKSGVCEPCGEEPEKKEKWIGWCYPATGSIAVTKQGEPSPGPLFVQVALSDSEQAAAIEATKNCNKQTSPIITTPVPIPPLDPYQSVACDFKWYLNAKGPFSASSRLSLIQQIGAEAQNNLATGELGFGGINIDNVGQVISAAVRYFSGNPPYLAGKFIPRLVEAFGCKNDTFRNSIQTLAEFQFINRAVGVDLGDFLQPWKYAANLACPTQYLDPDKSIAAYLAGSIDNKSLSTLWGMNGICAEATEWYRQAARSKPTPLQLAVMRHRQIIDPAIYQTKMRQLGFVEPDVSEKLFDITYQVPTMTDLTRLMVRDADDETIPFWPESDKLFDEKFRDTLKKWATDQGIPEKFFKYYWRAHWSIPSPGQLFEFWHRLRKDDKFGGEAELLKQIKSALIQQDILPFWHDYYLAVSFRPMGRVDIRRAYNIGTLTDDEVKAAYTQLGYSDETVEALFKFSRRLRDNSIIAHRAVKLWLSFSIGIDDCKQRLAAEGFPDDAIGKALSDAEAGFVSSELSKAYVRGEMQRSDFVARLTNHGVTDNGANSIADKLGLRIRKSPAIGDFAVGLLSYNDARDEMIGYGMDVSVTDTILRDANRAIKQAMLTQCQRGIKRRYLLGELTREESITAILGHGMEPSRANQLAESWDCEKSSLGRAVPTARLCGWLERGVISTVDFVKRLTNIGHDETDAISIVNDCLIATNTKRIKKAEKEAADKQKEQLAAARQAAKFSAAVQRQEAQLAANREKQRKARQNRAKQLTSAIEKFTDKCTCDLWAASEFMKGEQARLERDYGLTIDETLQVMLLSVEEWQGGEPSGYTPIANSFAETTANVPIA